MAVDTLDQNPQINTVLLAVRQQLRVALVPGSFGDIVQTEPASVHNGRLSKWKMGFVPAIDLTLPGKSGKR